MHLFLLVGASGSGKTTLIKNMVKLGGKEPQAVTTRKPRGDDGDNSYLFVSPEKFLEMHKEGRLIFDEIFNGNLYATDVDDLNGICFVPVAPIGLEKVRNVLSEREYTAIYVECDEAERVRRMTSRGDKPSDVIDRMRNDRKVFKDVYHKCPYKITSTDPEQDLEELKSVVAEVLQEKE